MSRLWLRQWWRLGSRKLEDEGDSRDAARKGVEQK